ncbi:Type I-MYXAN CRISPR-associated protein Cas6/Cmx6 [Gammaproteobacteria bacterium]
MSNTTDVGSSGQNNLYWQEDVPAIPVVGDVMDLAFAITCRSLPLDHAWALSQAIQGALPWWLNEPQAGLHLIHGGESGNGWYRPEGREDTLYLTRRVRLVLRLPHHRIADAQSSLTGRTLEVAGNPLVVGTAVKRPLNYHPALYARHVVTGPTADEGIFLANAAQELGAMAVRFKKMLAGKSGVLTTPEGPCTTRSLLVAELRPEDALELQRRGLGPRRTLGCGLFVPHKSIVSTGINGMSR